MKTMFYTKGRLMATISKVELQRTKFFRGGTCFCIIYPDTERKSKVRRYFSNFFEAESCLINLGYKGENDAEYKGIAIRWRERGIHNVMDTIYKDGYYMFLPPFPGTIFYDAATIEEAKAEIDRLENLSNC